jgi:hypothetical protein
MRKSFWLAFASYLVPTFPLGYTWHLVLFKDVYAALDIYRDQVIIPFGLASMIIQASIFSSLYPRVFNRDHGAWLRSTCTFGGLAALLAWSFAVLPVAAKYRMASVSTFMGLESAFTLVQFAVVAPLIALAYRRRAG